MKENILGISKASLTERDIQAEIKREREIDTERRDIVRDSETEKGQRWSEIERRDRDKEEM